MALDHLERCILERQRLGMTLRELNTRATFRGALAGGLMHRQRTVERRYLGAARGSLMA